MQTNNILFILTDSYVLYTCPLVLSIIRNFSNLTNFYYLAPDISSKNVDLLSSFASLHGSHAHFIDCNPDIYKEFMSTERYPAFLYSKLIPHCYLPDNLSRVLGLDVDTIVTGNIDDLYNENIDGYFLAACHNKRSLMNLWQLRIDSEYFQEGFNGGVILYNLDLLRKNITLGTYLSWLKEYIKKTGKHQEQFEEWIMSNALSGKYKLLMPFDYNFNISAYELYQNYCNALNRHPLQRIVHFQGVNIGSKGIKVGKPWEYYKHFILGEQDIICHSPFYKFYQLWWEYASLLPDEILNFYKNGC